MDQAAPPARLPPRLPRSCGVISPSPTPFADAGTTSPSSSASPAPSFKIKPDTLEELLDDCFQISIGQQHVLCESHIQYATNFDKYLTSLHCHENLAFLMEIFKYEYFYDKIFPENLNWVRSRNPLLTFTSGGGAYSSFLNSSLPSAIDQLPFPTKQMSRKSRRHSRSNSRKALILATSDASGVFDFGFDEHLPTENVWDKLKDQHVDSTDLELELEYDCEVDRSVLHDQWAYIISNFVREDSPQQLNLANTTVKELLEKDHDDCIHNPVILLDAKHEIIQLLRENVYGSFVSQHDPSRSGSRYASGGESASGSRVHSRPQSPPIICSASNCCQTTKVSVSTASSLAHTPAQTPIPASKQSPSQLHHPTALKKTVVPTSPLNGSRGCECELREGVVSPVPLVKRKTPKFFPHIGSSTPSDSSGSDFSISSIISHFKSSSVATPGNTNLRNLVTPHPQTASALSSGLSLPVIADSEPTLRPSSTAEANPPSNSHTHRLGKLWKRRK